MKIEKLRNNHKKEIIIGTVLTVVIGGALTFRLTHSKYRVTQSIDLGSGVINYKVLDFKIMAIKVSEDGNTYNDTNIVPSSGYILNSTKSSCKVLDTVDNNITIEYSDGKINFLGATKKGTKCYLYFDKQTAADKILANVTVNDETPDFSKTATTNEGVYSTSDGMYGNTTYYWRGAVTNNYVKFAGYCWRIIRINGNKTIRLIYDGTTCHANGTSTAESIAVDNQAYNLSANASYYVGWTQNGTQRTNSTSATASNAKIQTESWYNSNIENNATYSAKVADGKFCNNRNVRKGNTWAINGSSFDYEDYENVGGWKPSMSCPNEDVYTIKVGAITASEVMFAGGTFSNNNSYYLYNGDSYWTMSPHSWASYNSTRAFVFVVSSSGSLSSYGLGSAYIYTGLRPVINLKSDVTFSSGDGTISSPYTVG